MLNIENIVIDENTYTDKIIREMMKTFSSTTADDIKKKKPIEIFKAWCANRNISDKQCDSIVNAIEDIFNINIEK